MTPITVVDACMGRGKSSAAIQYMNEHKGAKRFMYITPYLNEVDRICDQCGFDQSDSDYMSKSTELKLHLKKGKNIAATHSLFYIMDHEALKIVQESGYTLIVDESIQVISRMNVTSKDFELITGKLTDEMDGGRLVWKDKEYNGRFNDYKEMADTGSLYRLDSALLNIMNPDLLRSFEKVFMLTYLFDGQYQKAYLDYFGFEYHVVGVRLTEDGIVFSDERDKPPPMDYSKLIDIIDNQKMNAPGDGRYALSKAWFSRRGYDNPDVRALRNNLKRFYHSIPNSGANTRLWTSFKDDRDKLTDAKSGRFRKNFLQVGARATNEYRERTDIAYLANRFVDPNLMKFFSDKMIGIDADSFALAEMLQWIWRSAIRDGNPIHLYIPSKRMRTLLIDWIDSVSKGW